MPYNIYIIELADAAKAISRVQRANPGMDPGLPALYIGYTHAEAEERLEQHRRGYRASHIAQKIGARLWPGAEAIPDLTGLPTGEDAWRVKSEIVRKLREDGHCVWSH